MDQLHWLPAHTSLAEAITAVRSLPDALPRLTATARLAGHQRDFTATGRLDRLLTGCLTAKPGPDLALESGLTPLRVALLASHTVDHLVPSLRVAGLHRRLLLEVDVAPYGQYRQMLLADRSPLQEFRPQVVVFALDAIDSAMEPGPTASPAVVEASVAQRVAELRGLWRRARERFGARVVQQTILPTELSVFGHFDGLVPGSPAAVLDRLNRAIRDTAREDGVLLLDLAWDALRFPHPGWGDPVRWHQAKQLVSPILAPLYGDLLARVLAAAAGLSHKCLVLDLDNTLWGGVVGDDGIEGIQLGQGSATGEAYQAFQRYVARLAGRGVILAICSKNDSAIAAAAFSNHPGMALTRSDIAAFVANWNDKANNLRSIAQTLDIGLDSLVFVDDNPAERDIIRRELPMVAVPELPEDVASYPRCLAAAGYFEAASFTAEDAGRARSYAANAERRVALASATDMRGYLTGLEMTLTARSIVPAELARATQLINKTNQFNLTTRRYSETEVAALAAGPDTLALQGRLMDRFGDNGLISIILARPDAVWPGETLLIDTWLMSCRVLGRGVEAASLGALAACASALGKTTLIGEYRPTPKNALVRNHYAELGFAPIAAPAGAAPGSSFWRFTIGTAIPQYFMKVVTA
ncbi:MAG: HAD-IIIC family phosphatase [Acetobacteraceae bacterium]|nr:MAG: HAD-IIIC family phosphatase [Acetobacteraceae bacterium]